MTMRQALSARIAAINAKAPQKPAEDTGMIDMDFSGLEDAMEKGDQEEIARATCIRLFKEAELDQPFTFKTRPGKGKKYLNAMRSVLARMRGKAKRDKRKLDEFKLLLKSLEQTPACDIVTVIRTKASSMRAMSKYDAMLAFLSPTEDVNNDLDENEEESDYGSLADIVE